MGGKRRFLSIDWLWCFFIVGLISISLGLSTPLFAADEEEEEDEFTLEEITVTAEKREAELQKIPMDIDVVREQEMRFYNVNQINDLQKMIPDLSVNNTIGSFNLISIREVQTTLFNPIYEMTVSTHLDGIQLNRFAGLDNFFFDLERVEVLKGPQGTLYGRGSTAGSMNMITRKPILGEFSGNASIEAGNYGRYRADWAVNIPMGETLGIRISGRRYLSDGYSDSGYGDADSWSHRASLLWEPNDRTTFRLVGDYMESYDNGYSTYGDEGYYMTTYGDLEIVAQTSEDVYDSQYQSGGTVYSRFKSKWALGDLDDNFVDTDHYGIMASFNYDFDFATATIEYGHRAMTELKEFLYGGAYLYPHPFTTYSYVWGGVTYTGTTITAEGPPYTQVAVRVTDPYLFMITSITGNTNTLEARLTSNTSISGGDKIEWIVGAMAQRDTTAEQMETAEDAAVDNSSFWFLAQVKTKTEGVFTQASWMPFERWEITGGIRQNWDAKDLNSNYMDDDYDFFKAHAEWSELTYRANISYIADNMMPYLSYARGYRAGNIAYYGNEVPPEFLNSWELGFRSRFLDNKLQFNATYYYYDYENYSDWTNVSKCYEDDNGDHVCDDVTGSEEEGYPEYDPDTGVRYPDGTIDYNDYIYSVYAGYSPGGAEQQGVSANIIYLPTMNDRVSLSATWRHNEYKSGYNKLEAILALFPDADSPYTDFADYDYGGTEFGETPIRGNVSYTHTWLFGASDTLMATGTAFYEGKGIDEYVNQGFDNEYTMPGRDDYWTFDFSLLYSSSRWMGAGNMWSLRFSIQNIFDNDALYEVDYTDDAGWYITDAYAVGSGIMTGRFINPRTYSVTFSINF